MITRVVIFTTDPNDGSDAVWIEKTFIVFGKDEDEIYDWAISHFHSAKRYSDFQIETAEEITL